MTLVRTTSSWLGVATVVRRQKVRDVESALSLLRMLRVQEQRAQQEVIVLDKSQFYCGTGYESIWLPPGHHCLDSQPISRDMRSVTGTQIQQQLLLKRNTPATLRVAT
jgi:hypothetical protein